jgi:hypothetical protein
MLLFWGQIEYKPEVDVEIIVRDTCSIKRCNISACDWLNFLNLSVSLLWQLDYTTMRILWDFPILYILIFYPNQATCCTHPTPELNPYNVC